MAKYIKFSVADSGTLVYRSTGNAYRGEYTLKTSPSGLTTVYGKNGRKIGTVGKGTAKEQRTVREKDRRNFTRRKEAARKRQGKKDVASALEMLGAGDFDLGSIESWSTAKTEADYFPRDSWKKFEISFEEQRKMNFAKALSEGVAEGAISQGEAMDMWDEYNSASGADSWDSTRSDLWDELRERYDEYDFKYLNYDW